MSVPEPMKILIRTSIVAALFLGLYFSAYLASRGSLKLVGRDLHAPEPSFLASLFFPARVVQRQIDLWNTQFSYSGTWHADDHSGITVQLRLPSFDLCTMTIRDPKRGIDEPLFRDMRHHLHRTDEIVLTDTASQRLLLFGRTRGEPFQLSTPDPQTGSLKTILFVRHL